MPPRSNERDGRSEDLLSDITHLRPNASVEVIKAAKWVNIQGILTMQGT